MKHVYDNLEIMAALTEAARNVGEIRILGHERDSWRLREVNDVRAILDALPEPATGDWQECRFEEIQKGDRVRWVNPHNEDNESYEIIVHNVGNEERVLYSKTNSYYFPPGAVLDRIPAPVQHPDPAEHPVLLVHDTTRRVSLGGMTGVLQGDGSYAIYRSTNDIWGYLPPDEITDWSPGKVVEDDR